MRTCCPTCQTVFRVTPEQLRLRAGKVRCGQCRAVFNAIDNLVDGESHASSPAAPAKATPAVTVAPSAARASARTEPAPSLAGEAAAMPVVAGFSTAGAAIDHATPSSPTPTIDEPALAADESRSAERRLPDAATGDRSPAGDGAGLPGSSQWLGEMPRAPVSAERSVRTTFVVAAVLLASLLLGQLLFHLRGSIAISMPVLRPALKALSAVFGSEIPLPREAALVSIESSDLQADPGRDKRLVLQATLRNRASWAQAYPALELTLTDTRDKVVARRVLLPEEYLSPAAIEEGSFAPNAEIEVKLWLEAQQIEAAGYRLYVFYP
ncbi:MAG: family finger-like domain protein [Candidatus Accumulibacter adjunctus]|uniref:Family finger-like domain protein n=1 Tax=Candidatus Accumulibacter adjunctus TaxID=1454001 RepID=A0A011MRY2_9PROT|nr:MAG: family finger-like domain protein [Candidatus Accumulibacter adjunctus]